MAQKFYSLIYCLADTGVWQHHGSYESVRAAKDAGGVYHAGHSLRINCDGCGVWERPAGSFTWKRI